MTHFDRVQAVIEYDYKTSTERLLKFVDELSEAEIDEIKKTPFDM